MVRFSQFANTKLKAGDVLEVGKPEGKFTFEPQANDKKTMLLLLPEAVLHLFYQF